MDPIYEKVKKNKERILKSWESSLKAEMARANRVSHLILLNHLQGFLDGLSEFLKGDKEPSGAVKSGKSHGHQRYKLTNFTLEEILLEYRILRQVVFWILEEDEPMGIDDRNAVVDYIQLGMIEAASEFATLQARTIKETEKKFRSTFEQAAVGIAHVAIDGRWLKVNQKLCDITGYSEDELLRTTFQDITFPDDLDADLQFVKDLLAGTIHTYWLEKRYVKKNRELVWINLTVSLVRDDDDTPKYFISIVEDITLRKQAVEREQIMRVEAERYAKELELERHSREQFVSTLTHDLRSPLTAEKISAQLLLRAAKGDAKITALVMKILDANARIEQMITDLLDANRIRAGEHLMLKIGSHDLAHELDDIVTNMMIVYGDRIIYRGPEHLMGFWSSTYLRRAVENLINNAFKYGSPHTDVTVILEDKGQWVSVGIHNLGNPIPNELLPKLFLPFSRILTDFSSSKKGWGIGLTLVKGVAEAHGGSVHVASNKRDGTLFELILPKDSRPYQRFEVVSDITI